HRVDRRRRHLAHRAGHLVEDHGEDPVAERHPREGRRGLAHLDRCHGPRISVRPAKPAVDRNAPAQAADGFPIPKIPPPGCPHRSGRGKPTARPPWECDAAIRADAGRKFPTLTIAKRTTIQIAEVTTTATNTRRESPFAMGMRTGKAPKRNLGTEAVFELSQASATMPTR